MSYDANDSLDYLIDRLLAVAVNDRRAAETLNRIAQRLSIGLSALPEGSVSRRSSEVPTTEQPLSEEQLSVLLDRLDRAGALGDDTVDDPDPADLSSLGADPIAKLLESCHLKARAADWRARSLVDDPVSMNLRGQLIHEAHEVGVKLWMIVRNPLRNLSRDPLRYRHLAAAYNACAEALEVYRDSDAKQAASVLKLVAEAQSMMRVAAAQCGHGGTEDTGIMVYYWLQAEIQAQNIELNRYLSEDDAADPAGAERLRERVGRLRHSPMP